MCGDWGTHPKSPLVEGWGGPGSLAGETAGTFRGPRAGGATGHRWRGCFLEVLVIPRGVLAAWGQDEGCVVGLRRGGGPRWLHLSEGHSGGKGSIPGIQMQSLELHPQSRTVPLTPFSRPWGLQQPGCSPRPSISLTTLQFGALCPHGTHSATTPPPPRSRRWT